jgi:hypothetical protein
MSKLAHFSCLGLELSPTSSDKRLGRVLFRGKAGSRGIALSISGNVLLREVNVMSFP